MENQKLLEDDENRLYLLSVLKEMKTTSEHLNLDAKFYIINLFKKYQTKCIFTHPPSQIHQDFQAPVIAVPAIHPNLLLSKFPARIQHSVEIIPRHTHYPPKNPVFLSPNSPSVSPKTLKVL
jgi:hypothetical protein